MTNRHDDINTFLQWSYWIFRDVLGLGERKSAIGGSNQ